MPPAVAAASRPSPAGAAGTGGAIGPARTAKKTARRPAPRGIVS
jgi:hypothetical protein